jgi:glycosyltransferase involved in cell wall biosynthesis
MIRAAFDVHVLGRRATGNETYAEGLMRAFQAEPPRDIDLHFYRGRGSGAGAGAGRSRAIFPDWPYVRIPIATPIALALDRVDVAHFQYFAPPLCPAAVVLTVHDLSFERFPTYFPPSFTRRMRALMPWMVRRARRVIAVSEATRDDLVELYGLDPGKVDVVYNGASPDFHRIADRDALRASIAPLGVQRPFILCVGNLCRRKNQARVVRAFARLVERGLPHELVLVGKEEHSALEVREEIEVCGAAARIRSAGFVTREQLVALFNLADFSVYASHYEGFGLPVVESMACGTPVLTSRASCLPEVAGGAALLVDPSDDEAIEAAMMSLAEDKALRGRLSAAGLERSRAFRWDEAARRTLDTYRRAAERA